MPELMGMKNILVLNDEAHHCYREKPPRSGRRSAEGRRAQGSREEQRGRAAVDLRPRSRQSQARPLARPRSLGDAVLSARLRLRRRHALPLDDERLLADGRDRVRHRQAAARAGRREHPRRRDADLPQPLGAHRQGHAEEGPRRRAASSIRSSFRRCCRPRSRRSTATTRRRSSSGRSAGISVPPCFIIVCQNTAISKLVYDYVSGFYRKHGRRHRAARERPARALPQLRRDHGQSAAAAEHAADRLRAARSRATRSTTTSARWPRTRSSASAARSSSAPATRDAAENITDQELLREVMNTVGKTGPARRRHPLRRVRVDAHRRLGREQRHAHPRRPRVRHAASLRAGDRPRAPPAVVRPERRGPVQRRVRRHLRHSVRLHRQAGRRAADSRRARRSRSRPSARARPPGDPLPARRGLSRRAARRNG